jgi:hypothetical protein
VHCCALIKFHGYITQFVKRRYFIPDEEISTVLISQSPKYGTFYQKSLEHFGR